MIKWEVLPNKAWIMKKEEALSNKAWVIEEKALSDEVWIVKRKGQVMEKKVLLDETWVVKKWVKWKNSIWWYKSHVSISTNKFVEKCKKPTSSASIISHAAVLYWFQFRVPPCKEVHNIVIDTLFSNCTNATIFCTIPTLISSLYICLYNGCCRT